MPCRARLCVLPAVFVLSCGLGTECDRAGCDATDGPMTGVSIERGIAGAASSSSDVVTNGCAECSLSTATLELWPVGTPVGDQATAEATIVDPPTHTVEVDGTYEQALDAGHYLACRLLEGNGVCAAVTVPDAEVVTVHVVFQFAPTELRVFEPGSETPRETGIFTVGAG